MQCRRMGLVLSPAVLLLVLLAGCRTQTVAPVQTAVSPATAAKSQYVELTYPQSDDQGHYVGLPEAGDVTVSGLIAALSPPTGVVVNGTTVEPYLVQGVTPFGTPAGYQTYGFDAPMSLTPTSLLSVALQALGVTAPATTFAPNTDSTYSRLLALAGLTPKAPESQYRLGNAYLTSREYNKAVDAYNRSVALQPQFAWGYDGLGQTYVLMHRPGDAVIYFKKARKLHPKWANPSYRLAEVYNSQKRYDDAIAEYRQALNIWPNHPGLHRGFAVALYNRGHYQEAWKHVQTAEKSGAKSPADFKKRLQAKLPKTASKEAGRNGGDKQAGRDEKRQDGVRRDGPHAEELNNKPQKRQDGVREPGPHAQGQKHKPSKGN
ncbi:MAG: tetratricopeptide repeat protein [Armatimonadia bacterium]